MRRRGASGDCEDGARSGSLVLSGWGISTRPRSRIAGSTHRQESENANFYEGPRIS